MARAAQILAGTSTYTGTTRVNNGTLRVTGALVGGGAVTVGDQVAGHAAILAGSGTIAGAVTVNGPGSAGGTAGAIAAASGATLSLTGGLTLNDKSLANFALTSQGVGNASALIAITGNLSLSGAPIVNLTGSDAAGTYDLFSFSGSGPTSGFTLGTNPGGNFSYKLSYLSNEIDLIVASVGASASWNFAGSGSYSDTTRWDPMMQPNGAGLTATFGGGTSNTIDSTTVGGNAISVAIDGAYTAGALVFENSSVHYTLTNDSVVGDGLTLRSTSGSAGTSLTVNSGSHTIAANLKLADSGTNTIVLNGATSALTISGAISESGGSRAHCVSGGGTLTLGKANTFTGGATVAGSTLTTTADNALGSGSLALNSTGAAAIVNLGGNESLGSLSSAISGGGSAALNIAAGSAVSAGPASGTATFGGTLSLAAGGTPGSGAAFTKTGASTEILTAAPQLGDHSALNVANGTLRLAAVTGTASVGSGVKANIAGGSTLELAGSISSLGTATPADRVDINLSSAADTVLVSAGNQQVGGIDGPGTVQVATSASLTANHVAAGMLTIGGDPTHSAIVTIAASSPDGEPMAASGFALGSPQAGASFAAGTKNAASLLAESASGVNSVTGGSSVGDSSLGQLSLGGSVAAVPEPSAILLLAIGLAASLLGVAVGRCRERCQPLRVAAVRAGAANEET